MQTAPFSVILAANNEEAYIGDCLAALLAQNAGAGPLEVIVVANACTDRTVAIVTDQVPAFAARGWRLLCLDIAEPGKLNALNRGDAAATGDLRAYLDADVRCAPELFAQLRAALAPARALYATGTLQVARAQSRFTRLYAALWVQLPFVRGGAVGAGLFAVNAEGRRRWGEFPPIISDDTFVRLHFSPAERIEVPAPYLWPMVEGFRRLVRVRRRQNAGVAELHRLYPALIGNEAKARLTPLGALRLALRQPLAFAAYLAVHLTVPLKRAGADWSRGR
jgi:glycosyltransferase involved in cell wall biosynthesis